MDVKASTKTAKQTSLMTLVYHNMVHMILKKLLSVEDSMIDKKFAERLATAKTESQLDALAELVITKQLQSPTRKGWKIPSLDEMEIEVMHLVSYWNDKRVSSFEKFLS